MKCKLTMDYTCQKPCKSSQQQNIAVNFDLNRVSSSVHLHLYISASYGYKNAVVQVPENYRLPHLRSLDIVNFQNYFWMAGEKNSQIQGGLNLLLPAIRSFIFVLL